MLRLQCRNLPHCFLPLCHALPRQCKHQIYIHILKACLPHRMIIFQKFLYRVDSAQPVQNGILPCLHAHAQAVKAHFLQRRRHFIAQRSRVRLCRQLCICRNPKAFPNRLHQLCQHRNFQCCWRSAAKKYRNNLAIFIPLALRSDFCRQRIYIHLHLSFPSCPRGKITVKALLSAKRDMNI